MELDATKETIVRTWERGVSNYDELVGHGWLSRAQADAWKAALASYLPSPPASVLDVGAGTGVMSLLLAELGHRVTAVDLSPAMLDRARDKARQRDLSITFEIADAEALPFPDKSFDAVLGRHVLWTLPDPPRAVGEWRRVLRDGGRLVVIDTLPLPRTAAVGMKVLVGRLLELISLLRSSAPSPSGGGHGGGHGYPKEIYDRLPMLGVRDPQRYVRLFTQSGFEVVTVEPLERIRRLEVASMSRAERWRAQIRMYAFVARRR